MKKDNDLKQLSKDKSSLKKANYSWIIKITIMAFLISLFFSFCSEKLLPSINIILGIIVIFLVIIIGILFDMIGVAATSADEAPFHSMNSRRIKGAKTATSLIKGASKVSSFCCDVIGDICGIISGSAGVIISNKLALILNMNLFLVTLIITALIASITIGGKAMGKSIAINKSNFIIYRFAQILSLFMGYK